MKTEDSKSDPILGQQVHDYLVAQGVETPMFVQDRLRKDQAQIEIQETTRITMRALGLDLLDDSLRGTPARVANMMMSELYWGLDYSNFPKATVVDNKMNYDEMVMERNIQVYSTCEHHLLAILGKAHIAWIPDKVVPGLSKVNRIVDFFCRRPQIQERLTAQIYHALAFMLRTENIAVCIEAEHLCVKIRGVEDACSDTVTTKIGGTFRKEAVRAEFFSTIALSSKK